MVAGSSLVAIAPIHVRRGWKLAANTLSRLRGKERSVGLNTAAVEIAGSRSNRHEDTRCQVETSYRHHHEAPTQQTLASLWLAEILVRERGLRWH